MSNAEARRPNTPDNLELFFSRDPNVPGYLAGFPGYPRNFSRDVLLAAIICGDSMLIQSQLHVSAQFQGRKFDPITGEEPGKIHHEYPGVILREPYSTLYNACDTTSLFLIAINELAKDHPAKASIFQSFQKDKVDAAVEYIKRHVKDGIFWESPPEGADQFSLRVTYWKDSVVPNPTADEPAYPVTFALAHFQAALALETAAVLFGHDDLVDVADHMFRTGIAKFITPDHFCVMEDSSASLLQSSSDELHSLRYIPVKYRDLLPLDAIRERAQSLITPIGIACTPEAEAELLGDKYHGYIVWPFEQALIHQACVTYGLDDLARVARRVTAHIHEGQEQIHVKPPFAPDGNSRQLWSVAAKNYFLGLEPVKTLSAPPPPVR